MKGRGKLIGLLIGVLAGWGTRRPWLIAVGLVLGHLYDLGWLGGTRAGDAADSPPAPPTADPYEVLGVARDATDEEVEQAWRRRMQEYHPDRVANAAPELRALAERRAREANAAWEHIQKQRKP